MCFERKLKEEAREQRTQDGMMLLYAGVNLAEAEKKKCPTWIETDGQSANLLLAVH